MTKYHGVEMEAPAPFGLSRGTFELARAQESSSNGAKRVDMQEEMLGLLQSIESLLPATAHKMLVIIGSKEGEGTSTIAREFARVTSSLAGKSVLLLDADRTNPSLHLFFKIPSGHGWLEAIKNGSAFDRALYRVGDSSLFISPCTSTVSDASEILSSDSAEAFWDEVRHRFDFVIVDSAPLTKAPDSLAILPKANGALLVVGADSTERSLAENAKERIERIGGNIIGVIFNKERQYIPQFIGKCLQ